MILFIDRLAPSLVAPCIAMRFKKGTQASQKESKSEETRQILRTSAATGE